MAIEAATAVATPEARAERTDRIAAAAEIVGERGGPPGFVRDLFGRVPPEDLTPYAPAALADLALAARAHLATPRGPGASADIRLHDIAVERDGRRRDITVVEAVNADRPFLLDSTLAELIELGYEPRLVAHPILGVERGADGALGRVVGETTAEALGGTVLRESFIHVHLDRIDDEAARARLIAGLTCAYADVAAAADDREAMRARVAGGVATYRNGVPSLPEAEVAEALAFLDWLGDGNFVMLGLREYRFAQGLGEGAEPEAGPGLGVLRDASVMVLRRGGAYVAMTPEVRAFLTRPEALIVAKASLKSRVLRRAHLDYVGLKLFSAAGVLVGELRLVGLFTASAYTSRAEDVPYLRLKVGAVVARAGFDPASYAGRALLQVVETYPRDELFQIDGDTLYRFALAIMNLSERPRVRVLARADEFGRFVSLLVYTPKDRIDASVRRRIGAWLAQSLGGRASAAYPDWPEGPLARAHYIVGRDAETPPVIDQAALEAGVAALVATWGDGLRTALADALEGPRARVLAAAYADAFSAAYREAFVPADAVRDVGILARLNAERPRAVDLYRRAGDGDTKINLKVFSQGAAMPLSDRVPLLENLGFRVVNERTYRVAPGEAGEGGLTWMHDMALERATGGALDIARLERPVEAALLALFRGLAESDSYNRLVLEASLGWRDVALVRALGRYLQQLRSPYAQDYLAAALGRHAGIASQVVALFYARFDPRRGEGGTEGRSQAERTIREGIEVALVRVESLDDDRILRRFVNLVEAAVRTNFFQLGPNGMPRETVAFKFECRRVDGMPLPRPLFEIFLTSPRVEGLHLRFGRVARGGLRWSDRPQDFRTEVLGLVKAQQVKNAVIVPVGAKGGFFPKRLPPASDRAAWMAEGTESYRIFIRTLLELTDNIVGDGIQAPADTVRHDGDDPYLVVAADKGTATFSDIANAISLEKGHWLGDAFASGGSQGYDHKGMGITAKGAWEAVRRHFREIDRDPERDPIMVAGVGDMSGDVFGNGMLLSRTMRLVAAFDHRDIFLDPEPDAGRAFTERERLFALPRSSWADYDRAVISQGGGVFPRSAKTIPLSVQVQARLGLDKAEAAPAEVLRAILAAPVDLLWFGGIGTYVRAASESEEAAGDRANDAIRITGADLRAKVVGEGANLGLTQLGRIEAARRGIRLNTDAIDNSAGVNTSDVEVNIKVALSLPEKDGRLDASARNAFLAAMTDEVGRLVLRNNTLQTLALSLSQRRGAAETGFLQRLMQVLEGEGRLSRAVEFLPDDASLTERMRRGEGLTRPELAVLLAYAKLALHDALLASAVPDDPYLGRELERYFPTDLQARFPDAISGHRLRREIIATQLANAIVNRGGPAIVVRLSDETGADAPTVAAAYAATRDAYGLVALNGAIDTLDGTIPGAAQLELYAELQDLLMGRMVWFIRNVDLGAEGLEAVVARYREGIAAIAAALPDLLTADGRAQLAARTAEIEGRGAPADLARRLAALPALAAAPDIIRVAGEVGRPAIAIAATHYAVASFFGLDALFAAARAVKVEDTYDRIALERAVAAIGSAHRRLTGEAAEAGEGEVAVARWSETRGPALTRIREAVGAIAGSGLTLSKVSVAASLLGDLAGT